MRLLPPALCGYVLATVFADAAHLKIQGRRRSPQDLPTSILHRRGNIAGSSPLNNTADINYITNITLGGQSFSVLIDTGSSDLWVAGSVTASQDTGAKTSVQYAVGDVTGPVKTATLEFAGYTLKNQAYIQAVPDDDHTAGQGLIGLGPSSSSNIVGVTSSDVGNPPLDNIFQQNRSAPNFISVLMGRIDDPTDTFPGDLTVGEYVSGLEAIQNEPKLPVTEVSVVKGSQHFQALLDENGITGPDGKTIPLESDVSSATNKKQATVVFDTGFSLPQVPAHVAESLYGRFNGSELQNVTGLGKVWVLPCEMEVNMTWSFASHTYPIHPLDATIDPKTLNLPPLTNSLGENACFGSFQPVSFEKGTSYDIILGMAFLRNAYMLINFGDFVHKTTTTADPYIQLLSITNDSALTHQEFVKVRLAGVDNTGQTTLGPGKTYTFDNGSSNPLKNKNTQRILIYVAIGVGALALIGGLIMMFGRRKKASKYRPLHDPAPHAIPLNMHVNNGFTPQPGPPRYTSMPPTQGPYHDPQQQRPY